jgi:hypothetical protein
VTDFRLVASPAVEIADFGRTGFGVVEAIPDRAPVFAGRFAGSSFEENSGDGSADSLTGLPGFFREPRRLAPDGWAEADWERALEAVLPTDFFFEGLFDSAFINRRSERLPRCASARRH